MAPGSLPTPAKTPRKRALHSEASIKPTARVLFPTSRPATIDEVTPRKARKFTKNLYSLSSFEENAESSEKIEIFTDSKERIPTADEDDEVRRQPCPPGQPEDDHGHHGPAGERTDTDRHRGATGEDDGDEPSGRRACREPDEVRAAERVPGEGLKDRTGPGEERTGSERGSSGAT